MILVGLVGVGRHKNGETELMTCGKKKKPSDGVIFVSACTCVKEDEEAALIAGCWLHVGCEDYTFSCCGHTEMPQKQSSRG